MTKFMTKLQFKGSTRCFDRVENTFTAVKAGQIRDSAATTCIDADKGTLDFAVDADEFEKRRQARKLPANADHNRVLRTYADQAGSAVTGAVAYPGGKVEFVYYAQI